MSVNDTFLFVYRIFACTWIPLSLYIMAHKKINYLRKLLFFSVSIIGYIISQCIKYSWGMSILLILSGIAMYYIVERKKCVVFLVPIAYIIVLNSNYIVPNLYSLFLGDSDLYLKWFTIPYCSAITLLIVLFSLIIRKIIVLTRQKTDVYRSKEMGIFATFILAVCTFVCFYANYGYHTYGFEKNYTIIMFICTIAVGCIIIVVFGVVYGKEIKRRKEEENRNILEYTKHVEEMYDELRSFRHDYVNILASLSGYIDNKDWDGLGKFFDENIMPTNMRMNQGKYRLQKLSKLHDSAIKGLLSNKIIYAMNQGIDVFVDLMDEIKDISINTIDLCRVLGIYMDNAIEAAKECDNKEIKFNVVKEDNSVIFVIMNSFVNHGLSLSDMEKQKISSKGEGRGLGLNNVKEILSRYDNVNKVTEIKDNYFIQTLIIENLMD